MENKLNPLQVFQSAGVADSFLPVDFEQKNVLFWRVPELLEKNKDNRKAKEVTPGPETNRHEFWQSRSFATKMYIKQSILRYIDEKKTEDLKNKDIYTKIFKILESSSSGRVGAHLAGLYVDCSKIPQLLEMPKDEARRIVDNNLVLANVACIYSAFVENKFDRKDYQNQESYDEAVNRCEEAKSLFMTTLKLISQPNVHLKPVFCKAKKVDGKIVEREYVEADENFKFEKEGDIVPLTLQADLINQFNEEGVFKPDDMLWVQRISIRNAESKQRKKEQQPTKKVSTFGGE